MESVEAAKSVARTVGNMLQSRLELFTLEAAIEKKRIVFLIAGALVIAGLILLAISFLGLFSVLLAPPGQRAFAAAMCAAGFIGLASILGVIMWLSVKDGGRPFQHTKDELQKDLICLKTATNFEESKKLSA